MQLEATVTLDGRVAKTAFQHQSVEAAERELTARRLAVTDKLAEISKRIRAYTRFHGTNNLPQPKLAPNFPVVIFGRQFTPQQFVRAAFKIRAL